MSGQRLGQRGALEVPEQLGALAQQFGLDPQQLSQGLADYLPQAGDKLTPDGQLAQGGDLLSQGLGMLQGFFNKS